MMKNSKNSGIMVKPVRYRGNGGGRDSYIIYDSGGFRKPKIEIPLPKLGY